MTMGIGYFVGGLVLVLYSILCFYVGFKRPTTLFKITKMKFGNKLSDDAVTKVCYVFSVIAVIAGMIVFYLGYVNA